MKLVKDIETPYKTYAIYELSPKEVEISEKRYLFHEKYSKYYVREMDHMDLIRKAKLESDYAYYVGMFNTVEECELFFENERLKVLVDRMRNSLDKAYDDMRVMMRQMDSIIDELKERSIM